MHIYNSKGERIENPDMGKGKLVEAVKYITHAAVEAIEEVFHYEEVESFPNGGKTVKKVVDVPGVKGKPERVEEEKYLLYQEYTPEELEEMNKNKTPSHAERLEAIEQALETVISTIEAFKKYIPK